jgi:YidC/Oxa1 family membrane protein insertase
LDNRRLLLAALLSMGVLLLWQVLFPSARPQPGAEAPHPPAEAGAAPSSPGSAAPTSVPQPAAGAPASGAQTAPAAAARPSAARDLPTEPTAGESEHRFVLENAQLRAEFSNRGAQLVSLVVKGTTADGGNALELVQPREQSPYPFALLDAGGAPTALDQALFAAATDSGAGGQELVFRYRGEPGAAFKRFVLRADGLLDFTIEADSDGFGVLVGPGLRALTATELESRQHPRAAVWSASGEVGALDARGAKEERRFSGAQLAWIGLEDTYFLSAIVPDKGLAEALVEPQLLVAGAAPTQFDARPLPGQNELTPEEKKLPRALRLVLRADDGRISGTSYWGPKQYDRLAALPWGLERTIQWGWRGFIARPMLKALQWIHAHLVANYGWSIVILTSVIKLALLPLSISAFKSMRKMQKLNPRMQAIRERWRGKLRDKQGRFNSDAQRQMNEEIMALYRQEGANPAGGCLPILVQLPIFFAFYTLLATTVELWHAPWLGWIKDLSSPDPYYVLPIVMGISQVLQQRMTPPPPDPVQRKLIQAMPIMFTVFSLGFASGLVLYWFTNNLWSIAQQALYNSFKDHHPEGGEPAAETPAKRGRGGRKS